MSGGCFVYLHVSRNLWGMESIIYEFMVLQAIWFLYRCWGELWTPEKGAASWLRSVCAYKSVFCVYVCKTENDLKKTVIEEILNMYDGE